MQRSPVRWAAAPGGKVAYQVIGDAGPALLFMSGGPWNVDCMWEQPSFVSFVSRLSSFARVIVYHPRGYALSDPIDLASPPAPEDWVQDVRWLLDAEGIDQAATMSGGEAAAFDLLTAATFPERVHSMVLIDPAPRLTRTHDYPYGYKPDDLDRIDEALLRGWGTGSLASAYGADLGDNEPFREWLGRAERSTVSPGVFAYIRRTLKALDVRGVVPLVQARALVITHEGDRHLPPAHGRYLAEHLANAELAERPGFWALAWMHDTDWTVQAIESFLTGTTHRAFDPDDRVLATVVFTDIVDSTGRAAALGDTRWRTLLDEHDRVVHNELVRFRGEYLKSTGDGMLATFDGPARAVRCSVALVEAARRVGLELRVGLHTGEVVRRGEDIGGIAVAIAARVVAQAAPGEVLVSSSLPPLVAGSALSFADRGAHQLKGVPGEWRLHAVDPNSVG